MSQLQEQDRARLAEWIGKRRIGFSLPADFFTTAEAYRADEQIFRRNWIYAGATAELAEPGSFFTLTVFGDPIVVLRSLDGSIRAFHNVCRHHGAKICLEERGQARRLRCTYHHWSYHLDGSLAVARGMPAGFDGAEYPLKQVAVEIVQGMIFICLAQDPPDISDFRAAASPYLAPHAAGRTKVAHRSTIIERANWKLVIENNRECYHCPGNHPEFLTASYDVTLPGDTRVDQAFAANLASHQAEWDAMELAHLDAGGGIHYRCIRLPLKPGFHSFTLDGEPGCRKLLGDLATPRLGSLRMFRPPNSWNHYLADHIINFRVIPLSPNETAVQTIWLVHEDAEEGVDYDVERLTKVWIKTNDQDRRLVEMNQEAIASSAYEPGPQSEEEFLVADFQDWYFAELAAIVDCPPAQSAGTKLGLAEPR